MHASRMGESCRRSTYRTWRVVRTVHGGLYVQYMEGCTYLFLGTDLMATMALLLNDTDMVIVKVMSTEAVDSSQSRMLPSDPPTAHVLQ